MNAEISNFEPNSDIIFKAYGSNAPLQAMGYFSATLNICKVSSHEKFYIIKGGKISLIGKETVIKLGLLKLNLAINSITNDGKLTKLAAIKGIEVDIPIDKKIQPVSQPLRRTPIPLEEAVDKKLDALLESDVIEPVKNHTGWVSPMVIIC
ncbi:uncharacterized protein LOC115875365 [Sitophilus oryzae]|uniref:Uncharacterized protein LOC115875365 n=1 Tax=Sitophilus oryzae TaxID=7048 RepID=A0A6J2X650_SITOR|nr:uncharacterized protein LOC115875365 [Sitophilus oryzae]